MLKVGSKADRAVLSLIALLQLAVSFLLLSIQFMAYGGGFQPISTPFRLFGFFNSFFLFTARPLPRIGSFLWHSIFLAWAFGYPFIYPVDMSNPSNQSIYTICVFMLISLIYLIASLRQEFAKRRWNWSAWLGWE